MKNFARLAAIIAGGFLAVAAARAASPAAEAWKVVEQTRRTFPGYQAGHPDAAGLPLFFDAPDAGAREKEATLNHATLLKLQLEDFVRRFADDKLRWEAQVLLAQITPGVQEGLAQEVDWAALRASLTEVIAAAGAPKEVKISAEFSWILVETNEAAKGIARPLFAEMIARMERFGAEHPRDYRAGRVAFWLGVILKPRDPARAEAAFVRAERSGDVEMAAKAATELVVLQYRRTPPELSFTATDGRKVSLAALRGKVVLIDFWATWCPPCRAEAPAVAAAYRRLHERGFEIVGISFDEDRRALEKFTAQHGMTWPQYFDGGGWATKYAREFKISSIPAMWLLGRDGRIVSADARGELEKLVEKLLAE